MPEMPVTLRAAAHGGPNGTITRVVIHDEEFGVGPDSALQIARFFSRPEAAGGPGTSAHYIVDADSIEHPVPEDTIAYHAPPNAGSIGIEHDGFSRFTAADWAKPGSVATLKRSAALVADICRRHELPVEFLSVDDLLRGHRGITTHANVSAAFRKSTHTDPGSQFPIDLYMSWVQAAYDDGNKSPLLKLGDRGPKVADVQRALNKCGNRLAVDGYLGPGTAAVLLTFQRHRAGAPWHLKATGTTDLDTWAALRAVAHPTKG